LKLIAAQLKPKKGDVVINPKTEMGYFGQMNIERLDPALSIIEEMEKSAVSLDQKAIRQVCGNMLFSGDLAKKKIKVLSGGEKSRVMLGKIILQQCNLLLLDEPTNHLDMDSCESLLAATEVFPGAVLIVTHSEYFLKKLANKLIVFDDNKVQFFDGDYELFLAKLGWSNESK
jgi:ATP-binding cassette subfamily F protein 3